MKIQDGKLVDGETTYDINEDGNALDSEGNVFKSKEELADVEVEEVKSDENEGGSQEFIEGTEVEIDDAVYTIDKDGNAIDKEGKVFKTKEELEELAGDSDDGDEEDKDSSSKTTPKYKDIIQQSQISIVDQSGNEVEFEDSPEGLINFAQAAYEQGGRDHANKGLKELVGKYPELDNVINHLTVHGTMKGYSDYSAFKSVTLDKDNESQLISVIQKEGEMSNTSPARVQRLIENSKASGELYQAAKESLEIMQAKITQKEQDRATQAQEIQAQQEQQQRQQFEVVTNAVNTGEIKFGESTIKIPVNIPVKVGDKTVVKTRQDFIDYLYKEKPYKLPNGQIVNATGYQIDNYKEDQQFGIQKELFDAFVKFTGKNPSKALANTIQSQVVKEQKKRIKLSTKGNVNNKGDQRKTGGMPKGIIQSRIK
jgi:hypothetical protein